MIRYINRKCKKVLKELQIDDTDIVDLIVRCVDYCNKNDIREVDINLSEIYRVVGDKLDRTPIAIKTQLIKYMSVHTTFNKELYSEVLGETKGRNVTFKKFMILLMKKLREE